MFPRSGLFASDLLHQTYSAEAGRAGSAVENMPEPWKAAYHRLKVRFELAL
jgi:hypothetical protein